MTPDTIEAMVNHILGHHACYSTSMEVNNVATQYEIKSVNEVPVWRR